VFQSVIVFRETEVSLRLFSRRSKIQFLTVAATDVRTTSGVFSTVRGGPVERFATLIARVFNLFILSRMRRIKTEYNTVKAELAQNYRNRDYPVR